MMLPSSQDFKNDKMDGVGTYSFATKDSYTGEYKEDRMEGEGRFAFANGVRLTVLSRCVLNL